MTTSNVVTDKEAARRILALYSEFGTWRAVEAETGVNGGLLWQVAHGKCRSNKARVAVGLPPLFAVVKPCPDCGHVHKRLKTCDEQRKSEKRHRRAAEFTPARARQFDAMLSERDTTLTAWMNEELDNWLGVTEV
jgi:hypothetical protein